MMKSTPVGAKYEIGHVVWCGYIRCLVTNVELFHGKYLYDLKVISLKVSRQYAAIEERYLSNDKDQDIPKNYLTERP